MRTVGQVTAVVTGSEQTWLIAPIIDQTNGLWPCSSFHGWKWSLIQSPSKPGPLGRRACSSSSARSVLLAGEEVADLHATCVPGVRLLMSAPRAREGSRPETWCTTSARRSQRSDPARVVRQADRRPDAVEVGEQGEDDASARAERLPGLAGRERAEAARPGGRTPRSRRRGVARCPRPGRAGDHRAPDVPILPGPARAG